LADEAAELVMKHRLRGAWTLLLLIVAPLSPTGIGQETVRNVQIRDLATIEGVRENPLVGYGMVIGLAGTGDRRQTMFSTQTLGNILLKMGVTIPASAVSVKNVAAVFVTASLPPFSRPGTQIDVTVSSIGDATSLEGGTLLLAPLYAADGQVYAEAQGPVTLGGYSAGRGGNSKQVNHPTAGRVPNGGLVERDASLDLRRLSTIALLAREPDFRTTRDMAAAINHEVGGSVAIAIDGRRVEISNLPSAGIPELLARLLSLRVEIHPHAKVVVSERTGTIVMGRDVRLTAVSILHGDLTVEISTEYQVSQPAPFSQGKTAVVPETQLEAKEEKVKHIELSEGASVQQLVEGLQAIGATARDVVAILQAIKAAGALQAELEVI
jgi:flagellar P-ring protein FlgI